MIRNAALALVASPLLLSAAPPDIDTAPVPMFTYMRQVKFVVCGRVRGTAWASGSNAVSSVNHVTESPNCTIADKPIQTTYADPKLDFSSSRVDDPESYPLSVDCRGIVDGRQYIAIGFAHGAPVQRTIVASFAANVLPGLKWDDNITMIGTERFIPGMSGGPVVDAETGEVVGLVKGYNSMPGVSYAVDIKRTPLCQ